jgi:hypothetical protein
MPETNISHQYQEHLGSFSKAPTQQPQATFDDPPIPPNQDDIELVTPEATLNVLRDPDSDIRQWLAYIEQQYTPPEHTDTLLLYPCASEKPMCDSRTYQSLSKTLSQYTEEQQRHIHVVTVSEPMGLIPFELQDGESFLYDNPGLFGWWVKKESDHDWNKHAQEQCLQILGDHIAGFLQRAIEQEWYDTRIACVRHVTAYGNQSGDQTHRQMLRHAEQTTDAPLDLQWLPQEDTVLALTDEVGPMAWQMTGVAHEAVQTELAETLSETLQ